MNAVYFALGWWIWMSSIKERFNRRFDNGRFRAWGNGVLLMGWPSQSTTPLRHSPTGCFTAHDSIFFDWQASHWSVTADCPVISIISRNDQILILFLHCWKWPVHQSSVSRCCSSHPLSSLVEGWSVKIFFSVIVPSWVLFSLNQAWLYDTVRQFYSLTFYEFSSSLHRFLASPEWLKNQGLTYRHNARDKVVHWNIDL